MNYHIWDDIPQLLEIVEQLGVESLHVVGHSRELRWRVLRLL